MLSSLTQRGFSRRAIMGLAALALGAGMLQAPAADATGGREESKQLQRAVGAGGIMKHLETLADIADENDATRASGTPGYDASAEYVINRLEGRGYDVTVQEFDFEYFKENTPSELEQTQPGQVTYVNGEDFTTMAYSGSGDVTAPVTNVDLALTDPSASSSGCETEDFTGFPAGDIALMQRGTCTFALKAQNAQAAGALAAIIFNQGTEGRIEVYAGTLGEGAGVTIPALGMSFTLGEEFASIDNLELRVFTDTVVETRTTSNVFTHTARGNPRNKVVLGAHLDSVPEGPGINDNGSGSASILEIALKMAKLDVRPRNQVQFSWWGAEESGLVGSTKYVESLTEEQAADIALYLNFDMVASPNFVRFVYDGDGSDFPDDGPGPEGSAQIEQAFVSHFDSKNLASAPTGFTGRSDYGPFIAVGIPAGGLFTGAEGVKTESEEEIFGGRAGVAYDRCYHQACDDILNLNTKVLGQMADAIAAVTMKYAFARNPMPSRARTSLRENAAPRMGAARR